MCALGRLFIQALTTHWDIFICKGGIFFCVAAEWKATRGSSLPPLPPPTSLPPLPPASTPIAGSCLAVPTAAALAAAASSRGREASSTGAAGSELDSFKDDWNSNGEERSLRARWYSRSPWQEQLALELASSGHAVRAALKSYLRRVPLPPQSTSICLAGQTWLPAQHAGGRGHVKYEAAARLTPPPPPPPHTQPPTPPCTHSPVQIP